MRLSLAALVLFASAGCGAKTGLLVPDVTIDADAGTDAAMDVPCGPGHFLLVHRNPEMVLIIDSSGSMADGLDGPFSSPSKWEILTNVLAMSLPPFQLSIDIGALVFPAGPQCHVSTQLDVEPGPGHAGDVLALMRRDFPGGSTPTNSAVATVGTILTPRVSRSHIEAMVLATDGGPNCNTSLDGDTCTCIGGGAGCVGRSGACLDDARTASTIASFNAQGVPTFVIGLDSTAAPQERAALERMAIAGGRPNMGTGQPAYYSVRDPPSILAAFNTIQEDVARCSLVVPSVPSDPDAVTIEINGTVVPRDPTHQAGWDWTNMAFGQIAFFGSSCTAVGLPGAVVVAIVDHCGG